MEHDVIDDGARVTAMASIPEHLAIIKMENDSIMAMAAARPRNHAKILASIKDQLATYKQFATSAIYTKPVGDGKTVKGLSVRAAESLAEAYGYCRVQTTLRPFGADGSVVVSASFVDYQNGRVWTTESIVSKKYKMSRARGGGMAEHPDDRFYDVVVKAAMSKCVREAILRCMPAGLKADFEDAIDEQLDSFLDENTVKKLTAQFSKKGVTVEQIEAFCSKKLDALTKEDRKALLGAWNALEEGETTVDQLFGGASPETQQKPKSESLAERLKTQGTPATAAAEPETAEPVAETKAAEPINDPEELKRRYQVAYKALMDAGNRATINEIAIQFELMNLSSVNVKKLDDAAMANLVDALEAAVAEIGK